MRDVLDDARRQDRAVGAFTCYDATTAAAVLDAAEAAATAVILLISPTALRRPHGIALTRALVALADVAAAPACVQLDHASRLETIEAALECDVGAVLADGSQLPFEDNIEFVRAVTALTAATGADIEVELGHVSGDEDLATAAARGALTDPRLAADFVRRTGADCLAVSIGNVHGRYAAPPVLDWNRLERVRAAVDVPLALHGASGLTDADVARAISGGVLKVNVNTEIREAQLSAVSRQLPQLLTEADVLGLTDTLYSQARAAVATKLAMLASGSLERVP